MNAGPGRERVLTLSLSMVGILAGFALCEGALRMLWPRSAFLDPMTDRYWKTLLHEGSTTSPRADGFSADAIYDPELGWRMRPEYESESVSHDEKGFRRVPHRSEAPSRARVLMIGDSFTYGLGVRDDETFAAYLRSEHGYEVVNAGVNAYGADQALLLWEREGQEIGADFVVLGYFVDDFYRNGLAVRDAPKPYFAYREASGDYVLQKPPPGNPRIWAKMEEFRLEPSLRALDGVRWLAKRIGSRAFGYYDREAYREHSKLNEYLLARLNASVNETGATLLVLIIGHCYDGVPAYLRAEEAIEQSCDLLGLKRINMAARMRKNGYAAFYDDHCHFSSEGHRFSADSIVRFLDSVSRDEYALPIASPDERVETPVEGKPEFTTNAKDREWRR